MKGYWSDTRPNGQPVEAGTVCFITDLEDGTLPIPTYGKDKEEVLEKLAQQNANAQLALARRAPAAPAGPAAPPPPPAKRLTADQVMQATANLTDPSKSPEAVATLFEHATGLSPEKVILQNFGNLADAWEEKHPEFFAHQGNRRMMAIEANGLAGGLGKVTEAHLDRAFTNLRNRGELFEPAVLSTETQPSPTFPDESQVQRQVERPRFAPRLATGARSTSFRSQAPARTYKYTEAEIRNMPLAKSRELINSGDKDYAEACDHYFGSSAQASA